MTSPTPLVCQSDETGERTVCNGKCTHSELVNAVILQDVSTVKSLLQNPVYLPTLNLPVHERTLVLLSCQFGNGPLTEVLLDAGVDVNAVGGPDGCTPAHAVSCSGRLDMLTTLVERGAEMNCRSARGRTPLWYAASNGHLSVVRSLVGMKSVDVDQPNYDGITPLIVAELNGFIETVVALISAGADVNLADFVGNTPLMHAVRSGQSSITAVLLAAHADPNKSNHAGVCPIHIAATHGNVAILGHLVLAGCDVNVPAGPSGDRPAMMAVRRGHCHALQRLITAGAEVDFQEATTPLLLNEAIISEHRQSINVMRTLIQGGCDVNQRAHAYEMTPMEYALLNSRRSAAMLLIQADSDAPRKLEVDLSRDDPGLYAKVMTFYGQPMSMKRLCRKSIRKYIGFGRGYERKVTSLLLPTSIKNFLLYTDLEVELLDLDR